MYVLAGMALAVIFASAAVAKSHSFAAFADYLRLPFGRHAKVAAATGIITEAIIAVGLAFPASHGAGLIGASIFLLGASGFVALRLTLSGSTECACWGIGASSSANQQDPLQLDGNGKELFLRIWRPVLISWRNGALLTVTWVLARDGGIGGGVSGVPLLLVIYVCPATFLLGLTVSIGMGRLLLNRDEHPLKTVLAPRLEPLLAVTWYLNKETASGWFVCAPGPSSTQLAPAITSSLVP